MRLWSLHPRYLDAKGLVALWREALLAQHVLLGKTRGYRHHPQLTRFRQADDPALAIGAYLARVADEADRRNYRFNRDKIVKTGQACQLDVTAGQVDYEFRHLLSKLQVRDPGRYDELKGSRALETHPLFRQVEGGVEAWEVVS